jgi:hypothetical protein
MKLKVAMSDLIDKRLIPQTAWPLVQPEPMRVPKPTNSPAKIKVMLLDSICKIGIGKTTL